MRVYILHGSPAAARSLTIAPVHAEKDGQRVSPFHDIPLAVDAEKGIFNMVVEIPKNTRYLYED